MAEIDYENYVIPQGDILTPEELAAYTDELGFPYPGSYVHSDARKTVRYRGVQAGQHLNRLMGRCDHNGHYFRPGSDDLKQVCQEAHKANLWRIPLLGECNKTLVFHDHSTFNEDTSFEHFHLESDITLEQIGEVLARQRTFGDYHDEVRISSENHSRRTSGNCDCGRGLKVAVWPISPRSKNSMHIDCEGTRFVCNWGGSYFILIPIKEKSCALSNAYRLGYRLYLNGDDPVTGQDYQDIIGILADAGYSRSTRCYLAAEDIKEAFLATVIREALIRLAITGRTAGWYEIDRQSFLEKRPINGNVTYSGMYYSRLNPMFLEWTLTKFPVILPANSKRPK